MRGPEWAKFPGRARMVGMTAVSYHVHAGATTKSCTLHHDFTNASPERHGSGAILLTSSLSFFPSPVVSHFPPGFSLPALSLRAYEYPRSRSTPVALVRA